jgi:hypothetical protein
VTVAAVVEAVVALKVSPAGSAAEVPSRVMV